MKNKLLPILISAILFFIPFLWLQPGQIDIGGDSSRLYFYDPINYLQSFPLWGLAPDGLGAGVVGYYLIPFVSILVLLKAILPSSYLIITLFNSLQLIVGFLSMYWLFIRLLAYPDHKKTEEVIIQFAAILGGLFYIFSPGLTHTGWDRAMFIHNQFFLNPLVVILLVCYIHSKKFIYILFILIISFVFAMNFTPSPSLFGFFPLVFFYLLLYWIFIAKTKINIRHMLAFGLIFVLLHLFHLLPQFRLVFFDTNDAFYQATFSQEGKLIRGLSYFESSAKDVKLVSNLLMLPQLPATQSHVRKFAEPFWFIFPSILILGAIVSTREYKKNKIRGKNYLLLFAFYLITVFLITAHITQIGFEIYKRLFYIPGFSMFRNFVGQFAFVFSFFYSLFFGYSVFYVISTLSKKKKILFVSGICAVILITSFPFIQGEMINLRINSGEKKPVKIPIIMDKTYEEALDYIRNDKTDGKYVTFPITDPGLQLLAGANGGAYMGPSTISYLAQTRDFSGIGVFGPYTDLLLHAVRDKDYTAIDNLISLLNIRYIFYNSDPYIFLGNFPQLPYDTVKEYFPITQQEYKNFIEKLAVHKKIDFGPKYHIYEVNTDRYLPRIYSPTKTIFTNQTLTSPWIFNLNPQRRSALMRISEVSQQKVGENADVYLFAENKNPLLLLYDNAHLHVHEPFIARNVDSLFYPLMLLREGYELKQTEKFPNEYLNLSLFYLSKRIFELMDFGREIPTHLHTTEPKFSFIPFIRKSTWEESLQRYEDGVAELIVWIDSSKTSGDWKIAAKVKVNEQILSHKIRLLGFIKNLDDVEKTNEEKKYLATFIIRMHDRLSDRLQLKTFDATIPYTLVVPPSQIGMYDIYLEDTHSDNALLSKSTLKIDNTLIYSTKDADGRIVFRRHSLPEEKSIPITLTYFPKNLVNKTQWIGAGETNAEIQDQKTNELALTRLNINNIVSNNSGGFVAQIDSWTPDRQYIITFTYRTHGDTLLFRLYDKKNQTNRNNGNKTLIGRANLYLERSLTATDWKTFQTIITSDPHTAVAYIQMLGDADKPKSTIEIQNLSVIEVPHPLLLFKKVINAEIQKKTPKITFKKINPAKYEVHVSGAKDPYVLVLNDDFNPSWKLYLSSGVNEDHSFFGIIGKFAGKIGSFLIGRIVDVNPSALEKSHQYFNGDVTASISDNTFLDRRTFETWGQKPIAEQNHYEVNGNPNGWIISPADVGGKTDYTLILDYNSQRLFYAPFFVSIATAFFCVIATAFLLVRTYLRLRKER